jgi:outer membrane lipoprotein-sorting protein
VARALALLSLLAAIAVAPPAAAGAEARRAVEAFLARLGGTPLVDLAIRQTVTIFHPDGRHPQSSAEQRLLIKLPRRQRLEQTIEGQREVRLSVGDRVWIRRADGATHEAPAGEGDRTYLFTAFDRSAVDLLAEWKSFGVRDDVTHVARVRGRPVTVIGAAPGDRSSPAVWLDAEYGVVRVVTHERLPQGRTLVDLALSEHRPLPGGFYYPHRQELFSNGRMLLRITVQSVTLNSNLPEDLFDPEALRQGR